MGSLTLDDTKRKTLFALGLRALQVPYHEVCKASCSRSE